MTRPATERENMKRSQWFYELFLYFYIKSLFCFQKYGDSIIFIFFYRPLQEVLETLKTLFQMDFLLPRTLVASLNLRELRQTLETELISVEVCCAALVYFVKTTDPKYFNGGKRVSILLIFRSLICRILSWSYLHPFKIFYYAATSFSLWVVLLLIVHRIS